MRRHCGSLLPSHLFSYAKWLSESKKAQVPASPQPGTPKGNARTDHYTTMWCPHLLTTRSSNFVAQHLTEGCSACSQVCSSSGAFHTQATARESSECHDAQHCAAASAKVTAKTRDPEWYVSCLLGLTSAFRLPSPPLSLFYVFLNGNAHKVVDSSLVSGAQSLHPPRWLPRHPLRHNAMVRSNALLFFSSNLTLDVQWWAS